MVRQLHFGGHFELLGERHQLPSCCFGRCFSLIFQHPLCCEGHKGTTNLEDLRATEAERFGFDISATASPSRGHLISLQECTRSDWTDSAIAIVAAYPYGDVVVLARANKLMAVIGRSPSVGVCIRLNSSPGTSRPDLSTVHRMLDTRRWPWPCISRGPLGADQILELDVCSRPWDSYNGHRLSVW